jgi:hypothetical protein
MADTKQRTRTKSRLLPRYWKVTIGRLTGLNFCDRSCGCGENNGLWWFPTPGGGGVPDWVPGWMNGGDTHEIWRWLVANGRDREASSAGA